MNRLEFLKVILASLVLRKLPLPQPTLYGVKKYALGFSITEEMLQDDLYGALGARARPPVS